MTFVLVHGAFHGAWCWDRVRPVLEQAGEDVITPTLPFPLEMLQISADEDVRWVRPRLGPQPMVTAPEALARMLLELR